MDSAEEQRPPPERRPGTTVLRMLVEARRKLKEPQVQAEIAAAVEEEIDAGQAAGRALGRAADRLHRLPVFIERVDIQPASLAEISEILPERALLAVIGLRDSFGVVALCTATMTALIEIHAIGRVTSRPVQNRAPTRTDAALCAEFVNALLVELGREMPAGHDLQRAGDYRYVSYLSDPRPLSLMLEDVDLLRVSASYRIGLGGQREGKLILVVPATHSAVIAAQPAPPAALEAPQEPDDAPAKQSLEKAVDQARIRLNGILCRRALSLAFLQEMSVGSIIPLTPNALDNVALETDLGQVVARGRLGENEGFHAIRLAAASAPRMAGELAEMQPSAPPLAETDFPPGSDLTEPDPFRAEVDGDPATQRATG
ncbi:FliM/FliN family flagellar motor C-terminal domain-containing protein [Paracoccus ravus]|uniref:FliM/FliN family flagellar motor C-terminal domain-containing protein n=1 Tax=Paracoccus ravus TaxID=2447760 RepID=UPI001430630A|nr:FliM/FliN family flagellar motor C-terminal domain-containing protein [Paracoccus ravus]